MINLLHEVLKSSLIQGGINPNLIHQSLGQSKGEIILAVFLKFKKQDVSVFPNNKIPQEENLLFNGLFKTI